MSSIPLEFRKAFRKIQSLKKNGMYEEALSNSKLLLKEFPDSGLALLQCGGLYQDLGDYDNAIQSFRLAVKKFPDTEKVSLCLFHSLLEIGFKDEALEEMKRFLRNNESEEYSRFQKNLNDDIEG